MAEGGGAVAAGPRHRLQTQEDMAERQRLGRGRRVTELRVSLRRPLGDPGVASVEKAVRDDASRDVVVLDTIVSDVLEVEVPQQEAVAALRVRTLPPARIDP